MGSRPRTQRKQLWQLHLHRIASHRIALHKWPSVQVLVISIRHDRAPAPAPASARNSGPATCNQLRNHAENQTDSMPKTQPLASWSLQLNWLPQRLHFKCSMPSIAIHAIQHKWFSGFRFWVSVLGARCWILGFQHFRWLFQNECSFCPPKAAATPAFAKRSAQSIYKLSIHCLVCSVCFSLSLQKLNFSPPKLGRWNFA